MQKKKSSITLREYLKAYNLHKSLEEEKNVLYSSFQKSQSTQQEVFQNIELRRQLKQVVKDKEKYEEIEEDIDRLNQQFNFKKRERKKIQEKVSTQSSLKPESSALKRAKKRNTQVYTTMDQYYMSRYSRMREENKTVFEKDIKKENTEILENKNNQRKKYRLTRAPSSLSSLTCMEGEKFQPFTPTTVDGNKTQKIENEKCFKKKQTLRKNSQISLK